MPTGSTKNPLPLTAPLGPLGSICRYGLATRGDAQLGADAYLHAINRDINYFNWCGCCDGLSAAVREMGPGRSSIFLAAQFAARTAAAARAELDKMLNDLGTDYLDVVTYYYVEEGAEWDQIISAGGAAETLTDGKAAGRVRMIGLTSHQRELAADIATTGAIDLLMIRYNAAHRGAERQIFPVTMPRSMPTLVVGMRATNRCCRHAHVKVGMVPQNRTSDCERTFIAGAAAHA